MANASFENAAKLVSLQTATNDNYITKHSQLNSKTGCYNVGQYLIMTFVIQKRRNQKM